MGCAQNIDELREAQRLRLSVFTQEYQANIPTRITGVDKDLFDAYYDHLIVRDQQSHEVVGTYRILDPHRAKRLKGYYSETEFFITRLNDLHGSMSELGRSRVHPDHRNGSFIKLLWSGIAPYMQHFGYSNLMGCASVRMRNDGRTAASLWWDFDFNTTGFLMLLNLNTMNPKYTWHFDTRSSTN